MPNASPLVSQARPSHVKTGRSGDIRIPAFVTLPTSDHDQSDHRTSNHVHSKVLKPSRAYISSTLGYASLKPEQEKVFSEFLGRKDVFVFLPTGLGKSFCYAALLLAFDLKRFGSV